MSTEPLTQGSAANGFPQEFFDLSYSPTGPRHTVESPLVDPFPRFEFDGPSLPDEDQSNYEPITIPPSPVPPPSIVLTISEWKPTLTLKDQVAFVKRERRIPKNELAQIFNLRLRDLRSLTLDNTDDSDRLLSNNFVGTLYTTMLVRPTAIIFHLESIQAVVKRDRVFFFNTHSPLMKTVMSNFPVRMKTTLGSNPFELRVVEALLVEWLDHLDREFKAIEPELEDLLESLLDRQDPPMFQRLHDLSNDLSEFEDRVARTRHVLTDLLNSNEDMAGMFLTRNNLHVITQEHDEAEMLLENFLIATAQLDARTSLLKRQILATENYIKIHFDGQRNRLMRMNLIVSFGTLAIGTGAFGAGIFGMNLLHGLESNPHAFAYVCIGLSSICASTFAASYAYYYQSKQSRRDHVIPSVLAAKPSCSFPPHEIARSEILVSASAATKMPSR